MSYDLVFWKQTAACEGQPASIYRALMDEKPVKGLAHLPVARIITAAEEKFPGTSEVEHNCSWDGGDRGAFELYATPACVVFSCCGMRGDDMNRIIDIGSAFDCPLYDPQVDRRFDGSRHESARPKGRTRGHRK